MRVRALRGARPGAPHARGALLGAVDALATHRNLVCSASGDAGVAILEVGAGGAFRGIWSRAATVAALLVARQAPRRLLVRAARRPSNVVRPVLVAWALQQALVACRVVSIPARAALCVCAAAATRACVARFVARDAYPFAVVHPFRERLFPRTAFQARAAVTDPVLWTAGTLGRRTAGALFAIVGALPARLPCVKGVVS